MRLALALVALVGAGCRSSGGTAAPRPSVLLVTLDTVRADRIGAYGHAGAATPRIDALARGGVRFETAVAAAPLTAPSHATLMTGRIPPRHGVRDNGFALPAGVPTLAEAFGAAGYRTAAFVSGFPLDRRFGLARGFAHYDDRLPRGDDSRRAPYVERRADATTDRALSFLAEADASPFFAWVHYFDPHAPYDPPAPFDESFAKAPYDGEIAFLDSQLGRLLDALKARPAIVLVTADHGEGLGDHGEDTHGLFVYDATLRVPFVLAAPGLAPRVAGVVARGVDVAPTLLDLAGVPPLAGADGRSLRAAAEGLAMPEAAAYAESLFAEQNLGWAPLYAWRTREWKLIHAPRSELYEIARDAGETHDRAGTETGRLDALRRPLEAAISRAPVHAGPASPESGERLRALGYLGGAQPAGSGSGRDPKDGLALVRRLERGMAEARADPPLAIRELTAVLAEDPRVAVAHRTRAIAHQSAARYDAALRDLDALAEFAPPSLEDLVLRAETLRLSGRAEDALAVLASAARQHPQAPDPDLFRARALRSLGRRGEAAAAFEAALARSPGHAEALRGLGDLALESGDLEAAGARYRQVLAGDPEDSAALARLGIVRVREGRLDEAVPLLQDAVRRDSRNPEALRALAGALAKSGRAKEAIPYFERAVAEGGEAPLVLNGLGLARLESGDRPGATTALRRSLALDPSQDRIAALLREIGGR